MDTHCFKVLSQSEAVTITRQDGTTTQKSIIVLQELGGKYADTYATTMVGNQIRLTAGDLVIASLRFTTHEYNGQQYQDCTILEIYKM